MHILLDFRLINHYRAPQAWHGNLTFCPGPVRYRVIGRHVSRWVDMRYWFGESNCMTKGVRPLHFTRYPALPYAAPPATKTENPNVTPFTLSLSAHLYWRRPYVDSQLGCSLSRQWSGGSSSHTLKQHTELLGLSPEGIHVRCQHFSSAMCVTVLHSYSGAGLVITKVDNPVAFT